MSPIAKAGDTVTVGLAYVMSDTPPYVRRGNMLRDEHTGKSFEVLRVYVKGGQLLAVLVPPGLVGADESDAEFDDFPVRRLIVTSKGAI